MKIRRRTLAEEREGKEIDGREKGKTFSSKGGMSDREKGITHRQRWYANEEAVET